MLALLSDKRIKIKVPERSKWLCHSGQAVELDNISLLFPIFAFTHSCALLLNTNHVPAWTSYIRWLTMVSLKWMQLGTIDTFDNKHILVVMSWSISFEYTHFGKKISWDILFLPSPAFPGRSRINLLSFSYPKVDVCCSSLIATILIFYKRSLSIINNILTFEDSSQTSKIHLVRTIEDHNVFSKAPSHIFCGFCFASACGSRWGSSHAHP